MTWAADSLVLGILLVLALSGTILFALAYLRVRTRRLLLLALAMLLLVVKASLLLAGLYVDEVAFVGDHHYLFDVGVVALLIISGFWE